MVEGISPKIRTSLYIDPNMWKKFKAICFREEEPMSQKIEQYIARYVAVHDKGNPQTRIDPFLGDYKTKQKCYRCEGQFPFLVHVKFISGLIAHVCKECLEDYRERTLIRKVLTK